ncbi:MAG: Tad domain-containing protein [Chloroflexota bacterium]
MTKQHGTQKGQSIVIIAFALIGILAFVGIAVDVGFVFARSTQLQSAVDSAALAGVVELVSNTDNAGPANRKAEQFLNTNGFSLTVGLPNQNDLGTGRALPATELGALQYELTVDWPVDLFFLEANWA